MAEDEITFNFRVYEDGKATVPRWVREKLDLKPGSVIVVKIIEVHK